MLLCKVHNLVTDQRYEFRAADQAEMDARLERKAATYGRAAWTETIPPWTETVVGWADPDGTMHDGIRYVEHPEQVIEHPSERTVEVIDLAPQEEAAARLAAVAAVQARLDLLAQSWGYDHILSLCSYATSKVPRFAAEAQIGVDWRDATWAAVMRYETTVASLAELIDLLPPVPTRPEIP